MARARELEQLGASYRKAHQGYLPDRVKRSGNKMTRKSFEALGDGIGWLSRLAMAGDKLKHYTIHLKALGLEHFEHEENLYQHQAVIAIKKAIHEAMPGTFWARLEVGKVGRRLHIHVLAHKAPTVAHIPREVESLKTIALYICKCQVPDTKPELSAGIFLKAKRQSQLEGKKRLPKTSFSRGIPKS